ncbi:MAG: low molecular weight protein arginine phosphatase [Bacillota bacterium]|nr:low molecular weight protein arginine phosphatase [Bacillota bacterium]
MKKKLLFVCTGNTCRSPLAAAFAREALAGAGLTHWTVDSAGLAARDGSPASDGSLHAAGDFGLDLSLHRAKPLSPLLVDSAALILTMTAAQKQVLLQALPQFADRIFSLTEYLGADGDVADPFGGPPSLYRETAHQLRSLVTRLAEKLKEC